MVWIYERVDELSRNIFEVSLDFSGARIALWVQWLGEGLHS